MNSCIYKITVGPVYYIGATKDARRRKNNHLCALRKGTHWCGGLTAHFTGDHSFSFEVVEACPPADLKDREAYYLGLHVGRPGCTNKSKDPERPNKGVSWSLAQRRDAGGANNSTSKPVEVVWPDGRTEVFESGSLAAEHFGIKTNTLLQWTAGKNPSPRDTKRPQRYQGTRLEGLHFQYKGVAE